jgi:flagellar basal-body rod protein FlgB
LAALAEKMKWHQARQTLLAENVANASTPNYVGRDLAPLSFEDNLPSVSSASFDMTTTQPGHIKVISASSGDGFSAQAQSGFEVTPEGNAVDVEDEMTKVASNEMDYQTVTSLYTRSLQLLKTALGRSA